MPQTPEDMFADKSYDGWDKLSPRQKVERMLSIHKSGHEAEGEDVSSAVLTPHTEILHDPFHCCHAINKERDAIYPM